MHDNKTRKPVFVESTSTPALDGGSECRLRLRGGLLTKKALSTASLLMLLLLGGLPGCSYVPYFSSERAAVVPHDQTSLWNLKLGREYTAEGRYELAKEHYLMALASCSDSETRTIVDHELHAVDLMIQTQR